MLSLNPAWLHRASAFAVVVAGSAIAWPWQNVVSVPHAGVIVSALGAGKLILEYLAGKAPPEEVIPSKTV